MFCFLRYAANCRLHQLAKGEESIAAVCGAHCEDNHVLKMISSLPHSTSQQLAIFVSYVL